mmetsp:Transcript_31711/g.43273  ORF Transcript_31711/g.43273 Transcript_31711/m.43273 type:complete len:217 (+) Transcript_31711:459-1109(+)
MFSGGKVVSAEPPPCFSLFNSCLLSNCVCCSLRSLRNTSRTSWSDSRKNCSVSERWPRMVAASDFICFSSLFLIWISLRSPAQSKVASSSSLLTVDLSSLARSLKRSMFTACCFSSWSTLSRRLLISLLRLWACLAYSISFSARMATSLLAVLSSYMSLFFSAWFSDDSAWWNFSSSNIRLLSASIFFASSPIADLASLSATSLKAAFWSSRSLNR